MDLNDIRKKIDTIDFEILKLLNERMELALRTKRLKSTITDTKRELSVIENVRRYSQGLVRQEFAQKIFENIIEESKWLQTQNLKFMGFQGEYGAHSELAAKNFDPTLIPIPCAEFVDVFEGVKNKILDFGIVPVENSLEGAMTEVNDLLLETELKIVGEYKLPIHHCLLALPDTDYREIKVVYSHPQALAQCRNFISRNKLEPRPFYDTAGAAKFLSTSRPKASAAIASRLCSELYNLEIIKENIEDNKFNFTRFVVLATESVKNGNKCSITFSTKHEAGALFRVLQIFSDAKLNLTRIESRPIRNDPGRFAFLLDFQGSDNDEKVIETLENVRKHTETYKFLGCYKEAG